MGLFSACTGTPPSTGRRRSAPVTPLSEAVSPPIGSRSQHCALSPARLEQELEDAAEDEWHDALETFEHHAHAGESSAERPLGDVPTPCEPLDDDARLPPNGVPAARRAAAVAELRAAILAHADSAAVAHLEDRSPATLERFLRARDYDVGVAAALFLEHRRWRGGFGWRVLGSEVPPSQYAEQKVALQALSRTGAPLLIVVARRHDREAAEPAVMRRFITFCLDKCVDALPPGGQLIAILDLASLGRRNLDVASLITCFDILQKSYVERVQHIWFMRPPALFYGIWKLVSPFVAPKTRAKIAFLYGADVAAATLAHYAPGDVPVEYGGTGAFRAVGPGPAPWEALDAPRRRRY